MFAQQVTSNSSGRRMISLEVSTTDLIYAALEPGDAESQRLRFRRLPWRKEASSLSAPEGRKELAAALAILVQEERLGGSRCRIALGSEFCVTRVVAGTTEKVHKELHQLQLRSSHYLSLGMGQKTFSQCVRPLDAKRSQAWMTVMSEPGLEALLRAAKDVGLKPRAIEHSLVALSRAVGRTGRDAESPVIIVELNRRGVELGVSYQGRLLLDYRPGGSEAKERLAETVMQHLDRIQRYCSQHFQLASARITRVVLWGEAADVDMAQSQFASLGQLTADVLDPREVCGTWHCAGLDARDGWLLAALGSLLACEPGADSSSAPDLLEPTRLRQRQPLVPALLKLSWPLAASVLLTLGIYGASLWEQHCAAGYEAAVAQIKSHEDLETAQKLVLGRADAKLRYLTGIQSQLAQPMWNDFLADVGSCLPKGVWLESLQVDRDGKVSFSGPSFSENGVYEFVEQLKAIQGVKNVALEGTRPTQLSSGPATLFDVKCILNGPNASAKGT